MLVIGTGINMIELFLHPIKNMKKSCAIRKAKKAAKKVRAKKLHLNAAQTFESRRTSKEIRQ